jgi:uncharacterized membrane protein YfcA
LFSPIEAISIAAIAAMLGNVMLWPEAVKMAHWPEVAPVSTTLAVAIPLGLMFLISANPILIRRRMGVFILAAAVVLMTGWTFGGKRSVLTSVVTGALTGGITGGFGIPGGPFMVIYFLSAPVASPTQRANIIVAGSVGMVVMIGGVIFEGAYVQGTIMRTIIIAPVFLAGAWAGRTLFKIARITWFKNVTYTILVATGIMGLLFEELSARPSGEPGRVLKVVVSHRRAERLHDRSVEFGRGLLAGRQQGFVDHVAQLILKRRLGRRDQIRIEQQVDHRCGQCLGPDKAALVRDLCGERDAGGPVVIADVGNIRGEPHPSHGHDPGNVAAVVRCRDLRRWPFKGRRRRPQPDGVDAGFLLNRPGQLLLRFAPLGHADQFGVALNNFSQSLIGANRPYRAPHIDLEFSVGHQRGPLGDPLSLFEKTP